MKKLLIMGLLSISFQALTAPTGIIVEDPIVKSLRERFEAASVPSDSELLSQTFKCKEVDARASKFKTTSYKKNLSFSSFDSFLVPNLKGSKFDGILMTNDGTQVIGVTKKQQYASVRTDEKGNLLIEVTSKFNKSQNEDALVESLPENQRAVSYTLCVKEGSNVTE